MQTVELAAGLVSAYVGHNQLPLAEVPNLFRAIHAELEKIKSGVTQAATPEPAVPAKKSVTDGYLICLEDGRKLTMLKRYLRTHYNMSPDEYRKRWGLPIDYPMVAPAYARLRSAFAKKIGLGNSRKGRGRK